MLLQNAKFDDSDSSDSNEVSPMNNAAQVAAAEH